MDFSIISNNSRLEDWIFQELVEIFSQKRIVIMQTKSPFYLIPTSLSNYYQEMSIQTKKRIKKKNIKTFNSESMISQTILKLDEEIKKKYLKNGFLLIGNIENNISPIRIHYFNPTFKQSKPDLLNKGKVEKTINNKNSHNNQRKYSEHSIYSNSKKKIKKQEQNYINYNYSYINNSYSYINNNYNNSNYFIFSRLIENLNLIAISKKNIVILDSKYPIEPLLNFLAELHLPYKNYLFIILSQNNTKKKEIIDNEEYSKLKNANRLEKIQEIESILEIIKNKFPISYKNYNNIIHLSPLNKKKKDIDILDFNNEKKNIKSLDYKEKDNRFDDYKDITNPFDIFVNLKGGLASLLLKIIIKNIFNNIIEKIQILEKGRNEFILQIITFQSKLNDTTQYFNSLEKIFKSKTNNQNNLYGIKSNNADNLTIEKKKILEKKKIVNKENSNNLSDYKDSVYFENSLYNNKSYISKNEDLFAIEGIKKKPVGLDIFILNTIYENINFSFQIFNFSSEPRWSFIYPRFVKIAKIAIIFYEIDNSDSIIRMEELCEQISRQNPNLNILVIGYNKKKRIDNKLEQMYNDNKSNKLNNLEKENRYDNINEKNNFNGFKRKNEEKYKKVENKQIGKVENKQIGKVENKQIGKVENKQIRKIENKHEKENNNVDNNNEELKNLNSELENLDEQIEIQLSKWLTRFSNIIGHFEIDFDDNWNIQRSFKRILDYFISKYQLKVNTENMIGHISYPLQTKFRSPWGIRYGSFFRQYLFEYAHGLLNNQNMITTENNNANILVKVNYNKRNNQILTNYINKWKKELKLISTVKLKEELSWLLSIKNNSTNSILEGLIIIYFIRFLKEPKKIIEISKYLIDIRKKLPYSLLWLLYESLSIMLNNFDLATQNINGKYNSDLTYLIREFMIDLLYFQKIDRSQKGLITGNNFINKYEETNEINKDNKSNNEKNSNKKSQENNKINEKVIKNINNENRKLQKEDNNRNNQQLNIDINSSSIIDGINQSKDFQQNKDTTLTVKSIPIALIQSCSQFLCVEVNKEIISTNVHIKESLEEILLNMLFSGNENLIKIGIDTWNVHFKNQYPDWKDDLSLLYKYLPVNRRKYINTILLKQLSLLENDSLLKILNIIAEIKLEEAIYPIIDRLIFSPINLKRNYTKTLNSINPSRFPLRDYPDLMHHLSKKDYNYINKKIEHIFFFEDKEFRPKILTFIEHYPAQQIEHLVELALYDPVLKNRFHAIRIIRKFRLFNSFLTLLECYLYYQEHLIHDEIENTLKILFDSHNHLEISIKGITVNFDQFSNIFKRDSDFSINKIINNLTFEQQDFILTKLFERIKILIYPRAQNSKVQLNYIIKNLEYFSHPKVLEVLLYPVYKPIRAHFSLAYEIQLVLEKQLSRLNPEEISLDYLGILLNNFTPTFYQIQRIIERFILKVPYIKLIKALANYNLKKIKILNDFLIEKFNISISYFTRWKNMTTNKKLIDLLSIIMVNQSEPLSIDKLYSKIEHLDSLDKNEDDFKKSIDFNKINPNIIPKSNREILISTMVGTLSLNYSHSIKIVREFIKKYKNNNQLSVFLSEIEKRLNKLYNLSNNLGSGDDQFLL